MIDYTVMEVLWAMEHMAGKPNHYLVNAVMGGKLPEVTIKFDISNDEKGVPVKVQHTLEFGWLS